jgi:flagellar motor component MotA
MPDIRIKPTRFTLTMMRIASVIVALVGAVMIAGAVSNGLLEEGGEFVIIWIVACVGIIGFALFMAFNRKVIHDGIVSIEDAGDSQSSSDAQSVEARLKTLDGLKRQKLISDEEYRKQREKIIQSV